MMIYYKHSVLETIITLSACYENLLYDDEWQQYEEQDKNLFLFAFHSLIGKHGVYTGWRKLTGKHLPLNFIEYGRRQLRVVMK